MNIFKDDFQVAIAWFLLILSSCQATTSFIYMVKKHKSSKRFENVIVFLCNIFSIPCTVSYFLIIMHHQKYDALPSNSILCKSSTFILKSVVVVNKVLYSLILAFRYVVLKQNKEEDGNDVIIARRATGLVAGVFVILLFQAIFDYTYTSYTNVSDQKECFYLQNDLSEHLVYNLVTIGCFFVAIMLQSLILIESLRPSNDDSENEPNKPTLNLQKISKRNVLCTLVIYLNDLGLIAVRLMINLIEVPMFVVLLTNIVLNCVTLTLSFEDYITRIFPFMLLKPEKVFKRQVVQTVTANDPNLLKPGSFRLKVIHTYKQSSKKYCKSVS